MIAAVTQVEIAGLADRRQEEADLDAEITAAREWRNQLYAAMRACVRDLGGYEVVATLLDRRWGVDDDGEPDKENGVTATFLRAALTNTNRNRARIEWLHFFKLHSQEVAQLMASGCKPTKTDKELLADTQAEVRAVLSHKHAEALFQRARAR